MSTKHFFIFHQLKEQFYASNPINNKQIFEFSFKGTTYTLLCTRSPHSAGELYFRKPGAFESLILPMTDRFEVSLEFDKLPMPDLYQFFEFTYNPNKKFNLFDLFRTIDKNVHLKRVSNRTDTAHAFRLQTSDGLYYLGLVDHDRNQDGRHFTPENREKVQLLAYVLLRIPNLPI